MSCAAETEGADKDQEPADRDQEPAGMTPEPPERERLPREVWVLVAASFVIAVGYGIVAPVLPTFAANFNVGVTAASVVVSAFAFMRLAFAPVSGKLVAFFGERPVYVWGLVIVALTTGACAWADSYWQLLVFRSVGGTGSTMFTVSAVALLIRLTPAHQRGRASGLWATSFLLGNITGPLLGGGLVGISMRVPFVAYGISVLIAALIAWFFLRKSTVAAPRRSTDEPSITVAQALRHRAYLASLASGFANGWAVFGVRISLIPLFVTEALQGDEGLAGVSLAIFAAGNAAALMFAGRLADLRGRRPMALAGLAVAAAGTIWLGFTESPPAFLAASVVAGIGAGLLNPAQSAAVADVIGSAGRGGPVLATFQMASDLGAIIGPLAAGVLTDVISYQAAFAVTGFMSVLALLVWLFAEETLPSGATAASSARSSEPRRPPSGRATLPRWPSRNKRD